MGAQSHIGGDPMKCTPTPQAREFRLDPSRPGKSNPPSTPGPPVFRVPLWSAAVARLNREPLEMESCKCPMAGSVAMERRSK